MDEACKIEITVKAVNKIKDSGIRKMGVNDIFMGNELGAIKNALLADGGRQILNIL